MAQQPVVDQGLLIVEALKSHSDVPQLVGLLWMSDQTVAETSIFYNTRHLQDRDIHAPRQNSNPQSQQANGRRPTT